MVKALQKQLQDAQADLANAQNGLNGLLSQNATYTKNYNTLSQTLADLQAQSAACKDKAAAIQAKINELLSAAAAIQPQIDASNAKIAGYEAEIASSLNTINSLSTGLPELKAKLAEQKKNLAYLQSQLLIAQENLRMAYIAGNDANTGVLQAKQNFEAAQARYTNETNTINTATLNLEKARAQEALHALALKEMIAHYSDALPYAIVPNGNGLTDAGTPYGNNPSGSALGPIKNNGNGAPGSFQIPNWTNYLSQAYGAGVNPAFSGSVNNLYPFTFSSTVSGNTVSNGGNLRQDTQTCNGGQVRSITGTVRSMTANSFVLEEYDGTLTTISVAPCTQLTANIPNYTLRSGDVAVVKGSVQSSRTVLMGQSVTCLH